MAVIASPLLCSLVPPVALQLRPPLRFRPPLLRLPHAFHPPSTHLPSLLLPRLHLGFPLLLLLSLVSPLPLCTCTPSSFHPTFSMPPTFHPPSTHAAGELEAGLVQAGVGGRTRHLGPPYVQLLAQVAGPQGQRAGQRRGHHFGQGPQVSVSLRRAGELNDGK